MKSAIFALFLASILLLPMASASTVTRSLSKATAAPGDIITVTLQVSITGGESYCLLDDAVPAGWSVLNQDPETESGHFKVAQIQDASDTTYSYQAIAPQQGGTYSFSGKYMFEGMTQEASVGGESSVTVSSGAAQPSGNNTLLIVLVVIAIVVVVAILAYRAKFRKRL